jgi:hypothetical protein
MSTVRRTIEIEVPLEFDCVVQLPSNDYWNGNNWEQGDGFEIDDADCATFSAADLFDIGRQARVLLGAGYDNATFGARIVAAVLEKTDAAAALNAVVECLVERGDLNPEGPEGDDRD